MCDLFGIAIAVLVTMLSLAFTPWTPVWWACVIIAALVAIATGIHITRQFLGRHKLIALLAVGCVGVFGICIGYWYFIKSSPSSIAAERAHFQ